MKFSLIEVFLYWVVGVGTFSVLFKDGIVSIFSKLKLPTFVSYYLILTPLVLVEEWLTCEISPYSACIQKTVPAFYIFFLFPFFIQSLIRIDHRLVVMFVGLLGWFNEMILVGRIYEMTLLENIITTIVVIPVYSVIAIIPCYFLKKEQEKNKNI